MLNRREAMRRTYAAALTLTGANWIPGLQFATNAQAQQDLKIDVVSGGSSSILHLRKAKSEVPVSRLNRTDQKTVKAVLSDLSIYRRLPEVLCETDPRVLEYFLDHPEVAVSLWRAMGVSELKLSRLSPWRFHADAGDGSVGSIRVMYKSKSERVVFCDGRFVNPVANKPIQAQCVIHFKNNYERDRRNATLARHSATMFVSLPHSAIEAAARVISPVSNRIADKNFEEVSLFVHMMSVAMSSRIGWCEALANRMDGIPEGESDRFLEIASAVYRDRGVLQTAGRAG